MNVNAGVAQQVEHRSRKAGVSGSNPDAGSKASIAQLAEHLSCKQGVPGSSPGAGSIIASRRQERNLSQTPFPSSSTCAASMTRSVA